MFIGTQGTAKPVKAIAVTAGKGGVGKTNIAVNLGIALAKTHKVMLLDSDLGLANVDTLLGLCPIRNLSHVIRGDCHLQDIVIELPSGLKIIPASSGQESLLNLDASVHGGLIQAFSALSDNIDILLVDTAPGISENVIKYLQAVQEIIVVVCDEPTSLTDSFALIKVLHQQYGCWRFRIIANMVRSVKEGRDLYTKLTRVTDQFLDVTLDYLGSIPFDHDVRLAVKQQRAFLDQFPNGSASQQLQKISEKISAWPIDESRDADHGFFLERLLHYKSANL